MNTNIKELVDAFRAQEQEAIELREVEKQERKEKEEARKSAARAAAASALLRVQEIVDYARIHGLKCSARLDGECVVFSYSAKSSCDFCDPYGVDLVINPQYNLPEKFELRGGDQGGYLNHFLWKTRGDLTDCLVAISRYVGQSVAKGYFFVHHD
jgi:hypothetical protein